MFRKQSFSITTEINFSLTYWLLFREGILQTLGRAEDVEADYDSEAVGS